MEYTRCYIEQRKKRTNYNPEYILEIQAPHKSEKKLFHFGRFVRNVVVFVYEHVVVVVVIDEDVFDCI